MAQAGKLDAYAIVKLAIIAVCIGALTAFALCRLDKAVQEKLAERRIRAYMSELLTDAYIKEMRP